MKSRYPKYRVSQWIDTSEEAMSQTNVRFVYGVQILREKGYNWTHCCAGTQPLIFGAPEEVLMLLICVVLVAYVIVLQIIEWEFLDREKRRINKKWKGE